MALADFVAQGLHVHAMADNRTVSRLALHCAVCSNHHREYEFVNVHLFPDVSNIDALHKVNNIIVVSILALIHYLDALRVRPAAAPGPHWHA